MNENIFMKLAIEHAKKAALSNEVPVGAVLILEKNEGHIDQSIFAKEILVEKKGPPPNINLLPCHLRPSR